MKSSFLRRLRSQLTKRKPLTPLVTHKHDVTLLQRAHGKSIPSIAQLRHIRDILSPAERLVLSISILVGIVGCVWGAMLVLGAYRVQVPAIGGTYTEAIVGGPQLVNPIFASVNDVDVDLTRLIYAGLMRYDEDQHLVTDLAKEYTVDEAGLIYTFTLHDTASWHDGERVTAKDVAYTIETIQDSVVNSPLRLSFQGVIVDVLDEYTVQFVLPETFPSFLSALTVGILPEHIWFDIPAEQMRLAGQNLRPIGSGPYVFSKLKKADAGFILKY